MLEMGAHTMALPLEEKMKFEQGDGGNSFGYPSQYPSFEEAQHLQVQVLRFECDRCQWCTRLGRVYQRFQGRCSGVPGYGAPQVSSYRGRAHGRRRASVRAQKYGGQSDTHERSQRPPWATAGVPSQAAHARGAQRKRGPMHQENASINTRVSRQGSNWGSYGLWIARMCLPGSRFRDGGLLTWRNSHSCITGCAAFKSCPLAQMSGSMSKYVGQCPFRSRFPRR